MNLRTIQVLLFVVALSVFAADFTMGCGGGYVYGQVTQKYKSGAGVSQETIAVNGRPFTVPADFWDQVSLGDWVRYNGKRWEKAEAPKSTPPGTYPTPGTPVPSTP